MFKKHGYETVECFDMIEFIDFKKILEPLELNENRLNRLFLLLTKSCKRLNPLAENQFIPKNLYKHSTRKRIIQLGITNWVDLAIYLMGLKTGEKKYYLNKYLKLISTSQQTRFLNRMFSIFIAFIDHENNNDQENNNNVF